MPDSSLVRPLPDTFYRRCDHDVMVHFERCYHCEAQREAERIAEARRVGDPAQRILDRIVERRRWFDRCAFCVPLAGTEERHAPDCCWLAQFEGADRG